MALERDIRMAELKQNISGCFRGSEGGKIFARTGGYVSTLHKNSLDILEGIHLLTNPATLHLYR